MVERHRGGNRSQDRGPRRGDGNDGGRDRGGDGDRERGGRGPGGPGGASGPGGPGGFRGRGDFGGSFGAPPMHRDRRPPAPPEEMDDFEDVDADLAIAILETSARLTELVGTSGLPEGHVERREAIIETFEAIYFSLLDTVMGEADEEDD